MNAKTKKALEGLKNAMQEYKNDVSLELCVSSGNGKIGRIKNISVAPLITCHGICGACADHCYDIKADLQYPEVMKARARNTVLLRENPMEFFVQALRAAKGQKKNLFRWNVGGEIDSLTHFHIIVKVAEMVPNTDFLIFTKRHYLVNGFVDRYGKLPSNLKLVFSFWPGMTMDNPHNFPVSCPYPTERPKTWIACLGNCEKCASLKIGCWTASAGDTIGFHYHGTESAEFAESWKAIAV